MHTQELIGPSQLAFERLNYAEPYVPGSLSDGRKLGLAIGSGGGAGPVTLGKLQALQHLGLLEMVDEIHTISVGAINASAVMANQIELALEGYDMMTKEGFIKKSRVHRIVDMRILERVLRSSRGLDIERITKSSAPIHVGVTQVSGGLRPISIDLSKQDPESVIDWLMRGAHLGIAAGPAPKDSSGVVYADGGFSHLSAVDMAFRNGCTDIIYLSNQPYNPDKYKRHQIMLLGAGLSLYDKFAIPTLSGVVRRQIASRKPFQDGLFTYEGTRVEAFFPPTPDCPDNALPTLFNNDPRRIEIGFRIGSLRVLERLASFLPTTHTQPAV